MSDRISAHLRSNIVGYIALFCFAMSGSAMALDGSNTVFGDDIVSGEVKSPDIADLGVRATDIADDAVTRDKILANAVRSPEISASAVADSELAPGSVSRDEFADGLFFAGDIRNAVGFDDVEIPDDAIQSNEISDGAVGAAELNVLTKLGPDTTIPDDGGTDLTFLEVNCDAGEKALGGGASTFGATGVYITQSVPVPDDTGDQVPTGWRATVENQSGSAQTGNAWVICAEAGTTGDKGAGRN